MPNVIINTSPMQYLYQTELLDILKTLYGQITEFQESLVILDDGLARRYARLLNIDFTGTLGVILKAKQEGYLAKVMPILDRLDALNFRISPATRLTIQKLAGEL